MYDNMVKEICKLCPTYPNFHQLQRYPSKKSYLNMTKRGIPGKVVQNKPSGHKLTYL